MHQALLVGVVQGLGHGRHQRRRRGEGEPRLIDPLRQVAALDEVGDDEAQAVVAAAQVEHGDDVGVVQAGDGAGLGQVGLGVLQRGDAVPVRHLDGHVPPQFVVVAPVDHAEAARADFAHNPVAAQASRALGLYGGRRVDRGGRRRGSQQGVAAQQDVERRFAAAGAAVHVGLDALPFRRRHRIVGVEGAAEQFGGRARHVRRHESTSTSVLPTVRQQRHPASDAPRARGIPVDHARPDRAVQQKSCVKPDDGRVVTGEEGWPRRPALKGKRTRRSFHPRFRRS